jgi:hypothetical protein
MFSNPTNIISASGTANFQTEKLLYRYYRYKKEFFKQVTNVPYKFYTVK